MQKGKQKNSAEERDHNETQQIGPRGQRKCKTQQGGSLLGNIVKLDSKALTSTGLLKKWLGIGARTLNSEFGK